MDINELLFTAFRASFVYFFLLLVVRVLGKREIGNTSAFDLIVALILVTFASSRSLSFYRLVTSPERLVLEKGKLVQENLQREWMRPEIVQFEMRLKGEEHPRDVKEARLEPGGQVSVLNTPSSKPIQKKDLRLLR